MFPQSVSAFFPAYNDAPSLPGLLEKAFRTLSAHVADFEVIVINDGSQDATGQVLAELQAQYGPRLRVITHPANRGYGGALRSGFWAAEKDWIFYTDGDGQYDPGELALLLQAAKPGVQLVNGYKRQRHDPAHRIWIGNAYNFFARQIFGVRLRDIDCDFRLIRRTALEEISLVSTSGTICVELVRKIERLGSTVVELPVSHYARQHGRSQFFRVRSLARTAKEIAMLYWRIVVMPAMGLQSSRAAAAARRLTNGSPAL